MSGTARIRELCPEHMAHVRELQQDALRWRTFRMAAEQDEDLHHLFEAAAEAIDEALAGAERDLETEA